MSHVNFHCWFYIVLLFYIKVNAKVNDEGARKFAEVIAKNKTLTFLNLETNMIGGDGVTAIAASLVKNDTLLDLKLSNQVLLRIDYYN